MEEATYIIQWEADISRYTTMYSIAVQMETVQAISTHGEMEKLHISTMYFMMERNRAFHLAEVQASHIIIMHTMEPMLPEKTQIQ